MDYDVIKEKVPGFVRRLGDYIVQGSNNTIGIFGTDRAAKGPATIAKGLGRIDDPDKGMGCGTIHFIAGRKDKNGDPDVMKDNAFLYLTMKSDMDTNLGLTSVESDSQKVPYAVLKSDAVRLVYRKDAKICIEDGLYYIYMDNSKITISANKGKTVIEMDGSKINIIAATEIDIGGDAKAAVHQSFMAEFDKHQHPTGTGPSGWPMVPQSDIPTNFTDGYKPKVKFPG